MHLEITTAKVLSVLEFNEQITASNEGAARKSAVLKEIMDDTTLSPEDKLNALKVTKKVEGWSLGMSIARHNPGSLTRQYIAALRQLKQTLGASKILDFISYQGKAFSHGHNTFSTLLGMYGDAESIRDFLQLMNECLYQDPLLPGNFAAQYEHQQLNQLVFIIAMLNNETRIIEFTKLHFSFFTGLANNKKLNDTFIDLSFLTSLVSKYVRANFNYDAALNNLAMYYDHFKKDHQNRWLISYLLTLPEQYDDEYLNKVRLVDNYFRINDIIYNLNNYLNTINVSLPIEFLNAGWRDLLRALHKSFALKSQKFPTPEAAAELCQKVVICLSRFLASAGTEVVFVSYKNIWQPSLVAELIAASGATPQDMVHFDQYIDKLVSCLNSDEEKIRFYENMILFCFKSVRDLHSLSVNGNSIKPEINLECRLNDLNKLIVSLRERLPVQDTQIFNSLNDASFQSFKDAILHLLTSDKNSEFDVIKSKIVKSQEIHHLLRYIDEYLQQPKSLWGKLVATVVGDNIQDCLIAIRNEIYNKIVSHLQLRKKLLSQLDVDITKLPLFQANPVVLDLSWTNSLNRPALSPLIPPYASAPPLDAPSAPMPQAQNIPIQSVAQKPSESVDDDNRSTTDHADDAANRIFEEYVRRGAEANKKIREEDERVAAEKAKKIQEENACRVAEQTRKTHEQNETLTPPYSQKNGAQEMSKTMDNLMSSTPVAGSSGNTTVFNLSAPQSLRDAPQSSVHASSFTFFGQNISAHGFRTEQKSAVATTPQISQPNNVENLSTEANEDLDTKLAQLTVADHLLENPEVAEPKTVTARFAKA